MAGRIDADEESRRAIHYRWIEMHPTGPFDPEQCFDCRFYIPLAGGLGSDWGACANPASPDDGTLVFEHHHCPEWELDEHYYDPPSHSAS